MIVPLRRGGGLPLGGAANGPVGPGAATQIAAERRCPYHGAATAARPLVSNAAVQTTAQ